MITDSTIDDFLRHLTTGLTLHLFVNDHTPAPSDSLPDYTEADFPGYQPQLLTKWFIVAGQARHAQVAFTLADDLRTPQQVYGWYLVRNSELVAADRHEEAPWPMSIARSKLKVTPHLALGE